jgi:hypothetical protein
MTGAAVGTISRFAIALLACAIIPVSVCGAAEPASAMEFVVPYATKACDGENRSWSILNQHTYLSIKVTLQWHPVGGKQMEETIVLSPQERRPVGCAPNAVIIAAELLQF